MADFFVTLQRQETLEGGAGGGLPEWFSTHPSPVDREASVRAQTAQWRGQLPKQSFRTDRETYLARIDGLIYGEDPRQGFREGDWFYLPQYQAQFRIPAQWTFAREGNRVQMGHPQEAGVILFSIQKGQVDQVSRDFVSSIKANVQQSANRTINGLKAREMVSVVTDGQQKALVVSHFFQKGGDVLMFHGLASEAGFAQLSATLRQPAASFAPLTDKAKLNRQPQRLVIRQVAKAATLERFLADQMIDRELWPRIAWMNELQLADQLQVGQRVKIVK
jgi:predicted Zn-dependent protease